MADGKIAEERMSMDVLGMRQRSVPTSVAFPKYQSLWRLVICLDESALSVSGWDSNLRNATLGTLFDQSAPASIHPRRSPDLGRLRPGIRQERKSENSRDVLPYLRLGSRIQEGVSRSSDQGSALDDYLVSLRGGKVPKLHPARTGAVIVAFYLTAHVIRYIAHSEHSDDSPIAFDEE